MTIPRSRLALFLDFWLLAALLLLFSPRLTGLPAHEWLGIALIPVVMLHLMLSWNWIAATTTALPASRKTRTRVNYLLNWLLFILIVVELTSGLMISQAALPSFGLQSLDDRSWRTVHNQALNWTHLVLALHLAMNWQPLLLLIRRHLPLVGRSRA